VANHLRAPVEARSVSPDSERRRDTNWGTKRTSGRRTTSRCGAKSNMITEDPRRNEHKERKGQHARKSVVGWQNASNISATELASRRQRGTYTPR